MLKTQEILDLIAEQPSAMFGGRIAYHQRSSRSGMNVSAVPESQRKFLEDLAEQCASVGREIYAHPMNDREAVPTKRDTSLTAVDLEWLRGLPSDPARVSYSDAAQLAKLAASISPTRDASGARLIAQRWQPVKEIHDGRAAQVTLRNAEGALPPVPSTVLNALAEAVAAESPDLHEDEARVRASRLLQEAVTSRTATHEASVMDARATVAHASEAAAVRTRVTKDTDEVAA